MSGELYFPLKLLHASCAATALVLFLWRGRLALQERAISRRWLRWIPDSVDTILLLSGISLVLVTGQYPRGDDWISLKLLAVATYIALGFVVLRFARTQGMRLAAFVAALAVFACIVWLAHARELPWAG